MNITISDVHLNLLLNQICTKKKKKTRACGFKNYDER